MMRKIGKSRVKIKKFNWVIILVFSLIALSIFCLFFGFIIQEKSIKTNKNSVNPKKNLTSWLQPKENRMTGRNVYGHVYLFILPKCSTQFGEGWNFFSLCAEPDNNSVDEILKNISYRYIMRWNTTRREFDVYSPKSAVNPFDELKNNESYFVLLYSPEDFYINGSENPDMNISLIHGWDAPSWPYLFETNVSKYFNDTAYRYIMKFNTSSQEFMVYSPRAAPEARPFSKIFKAEGQFLYTYFDNILKYNKTYLQDP